MSRRKLTPRDYAALKGGRPVTTYPPGGGPAEIRVPSKRQRRRQRNGESLRDRAKEGGVHLTRFPQPWRHKAL